MYARATTVYTRNNTCILRYVEVYIIDECTVRTIHHILADAVGSGQADHSSITHSSLFHNPYIDTECNSFPPQLHHLVLVRFPIL